MVIYTLDLFWQAYSRINLEQRLNKVLVCVWDGSQPETDILPGRMLKLPHFNKGIEIYVNTDPGNWTAWNWNYIL
jgi:hypothetical protein